MRIVFRFWLRGPRARCDRLIHSSAETFGKRIDSYTHPVRLSAAVVKQMRTVGRTCGFTFLLHIVPVCLKASVTSDPDERY